MAIKVEHQRHKSRRGMNFGIAAVLVGFAAIVFGMTVSKISSGGMIEGFDHAVRPSLTVPEAE